MLCRTVDVSCYTPNTPFLTCLGQGRLLIVVSHVALNHLFQPILNTTWVSNSWAWEENDDEFMARAAQFGDLWQIFQGTAGSVHQLNKKKQDSVGGPVCSEAPAIPRLDAVPRLETTKGRTIPRFLPRARR